MCTKEDNPGLKNIKENIYFNLCGGSILGDLAHSLSSVSESLNC